MMSSKAKIANFVVFQVAWLACALSPVYGYPWVGPLVAVFVAGLHFWLHANPKAEAKLLVAAAVIGFVMEATLIGLGFYAPLDVGTAIWVVPLWLNAMWTNFATTFNASMAWMKGRPALAAFFGATGGPSAYYAGSRLGALDFGDDLVAGLLALAVAWAIAMPILLWLAEKLSPDAKPADDSA